MNRLSARCPGCQSVFFVSAAHGKVANNLVRCGRCGHLFSLAEHLTDSLPDEPELPTVVEPGHEINISGVESTPPLSEKPRSKVEEPPQQEAFVSDSISPNPATLAIDAPGPDESPFFNPPKLEPGLQEDILLESTAKPKSTFWRRIGLSIIILIFGFVGIGGQYVFFHTSELSQQIEYRPWLQRFCDFLPCQLDAYRDLKLIHVERLAVRAHADLANSLLVELILTNTASAEQAYPALVLRFDDLTGRQVAARRFSPKEYLPQNLNAAALMPRDKAVSIKLAIVDPGETAVSYSVSISK